MSGVKKCSQVGLNASRSFNSGDIIYLKVRRSMENARSCNPEIVEHASQSRQTRANHRIRTHTARGPLPFEGTATAVTATTRPPSLPLRSPIDHQPSSRILSFRSGLSLFSLRIHPPASSASRVPPFSPTTLRCARAPAAPVLLTLRALLREAPMVERVKRGVSPPFLPFRSILYKRPTSVPSPSLSFSVFSLLPALRVAFEKGTDITERQPLVGRSRTQMGALSLTFALSETGMV
ncbi:hypothetical protein ISCGN_016068 [Ixodes scapularis]